MKLCIRPKIRTHNFGVKCLPWLCTTETISVGPRGAHDSLRIPQFNGEGSFIPVDDNNVNIVCVVGTSPCHSTIIMIPCSIFQPSLCDFLNVDGIRCVDMQRIVSSPRPSRIWSGTSAEKDSSVCYGVSECSIIAFTTYGFPCPETL